MRSEMMNFEYLCILNKKKSTMRLYSDEQLARLLDQDIFHHISAVADQLHIDCYVVGGYVRDLFLER